MDELINNVCQRTGLSQDKAREAVDTVVGFLKAKLPGPIGSQIDSALSGGGGIAEKLGGVFGKKSA